MTYRVRYTLAAKQDLVELYAFLLKRDIKAARSARGAIARSIDLLQDFPFTLNLPKKNSKPEMSRIK